MKTKNLMAIALCALLCKNVISQNNDGDLLKKTDVNANAQKKENYHKTIIDYTMSGNPSFGILCGWIRQHGIGLYIDYKGKGGFLGYQADDYTLNNNVVSYKGSFNNPQISSYIYNKSLNSVSQQFSIGATLRLFGDIKKVSGVLLVGAGILNIQHMYQYNAYDAKGNLTGSVAVLDKETKSLNVNFESMFLLNIKWFNIHAGFQLDAPTFMEAVVCGIGCSF